MKTSGQNQPTDERERQLRRDEALRSRGERVICETGTTILATGSLSLALLLGVESGSHPPTLDFSVTHLRFIICPLPCASAFTFPFPFHGPRRASLSPIGTRVTKNCTGFGSNSNERDTRVYEMSPLLNGSDVVSSRVPRVARRQSREYAARREENRRRRCPRIPRHPRNRNPYRRIAGQRVGPVLE